MEHEGEKTARTDASLGMMVAVRAAPSLEEAARFANILAAASIPALVQSREHGNIHFLSPAQGQVWVVVPESMRADALKVLEKTGRLVRVRAVPRRAPPPVPTLEGDAEAPDGPEESLERVLPSSGAVAPRLVVAGLAILAGTIGQRLVERAVGTRRAVDALAASPNHLGEWWRLVTAGFLHSSFAHHLGNAVFGLVLGVVLFGTHGIGATALVWLSSSMVGLLAEASLSPGALVLGASAGNYGLVGLWARGQLDRARHEVLPRRERYRTYGVLLLLVPGAMTPLTQSGSQVAVLAHLAGFLAGLALGYAFPRRLPERDLSALATRSTAALWAALAVVSLALLSARLALT